MDSLIQFGIDFIVRFQALGTWLAVPMKLFSFLGSEYFFMFFLPLIYWCVDAGLGIRIGLILLFSNGLNDILKMAMHGPRPYWVSASVRGLASETGFGVPSGHSQTAAGVWGMMAARISRTWAWVAAAGVVLLIGLSRLYLGVHFPHDVLLGWLLGGLTLWAFLKLWEPVAARLKQMTLGSQVLIAFAVSLAMVLVAALVVYLSRNFVLPVDWIVNATRDGNEAPNPLTLEGILTAAGTLFGLSAGLAWIASRGGWQVSGPVAKRALCFVVGVVGVAFCYFGLKLLFPHDDNLVSWVFRYVRYALLGAWVSAGAPWVFAKLQLTDKPNL